MGGGEYNGDLEVSKAPKAELSLFPEIQKVVQKVLLPRDMSAYPFHVSWYNQLVGPKFGLEFPDNCVAFVVISGPQVFEKCVLPHLNEVIREISSSSKGNEKMCTNDPLDDSVRAAFVTLCEELSGCGYETEAYHDYDLHPNRRPKVLVQTAAHVAGVCQYFHPSQLGAEDPSLDQMAQRTEGTWKSKKLFGVALHPEFGGWFAIRGVIVIKNLHMQMDRPDPLNLIHDQETLLFLLKEFSYNWKANHWRRVIESKGEYSTDFQDYLETSPGSRWEFLTSRRLIEF